MEEIAAGAGVAVPPVYSTCGGKRAILLELLGEMEREADRSGLLKILRERTEERGQLRAFIDFSLRLFKEDGGVVRMPSRERAIRISRCCGRQEEPGGWRLAASSSTAGRSAGFSARA
jgi:AcrR family transcriptional regulator